MRKIFYVPKSKDYMDYESEWKGVTALIQTGLSESMMNVPFLFITVFILFDQTLVPTSRTGKVLAAMLLSVMTLIFTTVGQVEAVVFGALFVQMLTPFINQFKWITSEDGTDQGKDALIFKKAISYILIILVLGAGIQASWSYYSPKIGLPKVDVLQYFENTYDRANFKQNLTPTRDYNVDAYDTITGVYEIINIDDSSIEVLIYDILTEGRNGPMQIVIAVDPYIDTIVGYVVVSHSETEGIGSRYAEEGVINTIINQTVQNFDIDVITGATETWDALDLIVQDVVANYTNEAVSLKVTVDVLQYFEGTYDRANFTQNETPTRDYNVDSYDTITGVYEIINNADSTIEVLIYDIVTEGIGGPIHVVIAVDPYIDTIIGYVVVSQNETEGIGALYSKPVIINSIIGQTVDNFNIDLISGATITWDALDLMVQDVITHYTTENVSLKNIVDVLHYFEYAYDRANYTQNLTPTRDYNVGAYNKITGVYEILKKAEKIELSELKTQSGLSNKKWDKTIKGLTKFNLAKVNNTDDGLFVELI